MATPLLDQGVRITLRWSSAGAGVPSARLETANKKRPDKPSRRLPIQQIRRLDIQAFNLCALRESESFSSTIPVLITGPQGFECPVLFTGDPEPAMD